MFLFVKTHSLQKFLYGSTNCILYNFLVPTVGTRSKFFKKEYLISSCSFFIIITEIQLANI